MGAARSTFVRACLDIVPVTDADLFLLAKRRYKPRRGWWIFGGGWPIGSSPRAALTTFAEAELGVTVAPRRFVEMPSYSLMWAERREPPSDEGAHDLIHPFALHLSDSELAAARRHLWRMVRDPNSEYEAFNEWGFPDLAETLGEPDPLVRILHSAVRPSERA